MFDLLLGGIRLHTMTKQFGKRLLITVSSTLLAISCHAQNLIVNGSFEMPFLATGANYFVAADVLAPWQTDGPVLELWVPNLPSEFGTNGRQHLEILSNDDGGTSVWQTVTTTGGEDYQLSFYHSPRPTVRSRFNVSINGQVIATFDEDGSVLEEFRWRRFKTNFTAAASTTISFTDDAPTAAGTHIDNVILERLPLRANLRVSEVELCWETVTGKLYQVQYRPTLTTNLWSELGIPTSGTGTTNCIRDAVPVGEPQRVYRVITIPWL